MPTTVGKILLKQHLPDSMQITDFSDQLDKGGIRGLFTNLATQHPQAYGKSAGGLTRLGFEIATREGSSVSLKDLTPDIDKQRKIQDLQKKVDEINGMPGSSKQEKEKKIQGLYNNFVKTIDKDLLHVGIRDNNTLAKAIVSGSRGSSAQLRRTVGLTGIVNDSRGNPMTKFPILSSFAEGLSPTEYLVHAHNEREGIITGKLGIADAGYLSKQLSRAGMSIRTEMADCETTKGISSPTNDDDLIGKFLAQAAGGHNRNNEITPTVLADLRNKKISSVVIRSPITCEASKESHANAICSLCIGRRENGLSRTNDFIGVSAGTSIGEPTSQGLLRAKHQLGSAASGFDLINQVANIPKTFKGKAAVAMHDGRVTRVVKESQGGSTIHLDNGEKHYVATGLNVNVKVGDKVEQGDILSEGIPNPAEITATRGVGEGRRMWSDTMSNAFKANGLHINKQNFDIMARGATNHVRITDGDGAGDYLPNEVVLYSNLEKTYKPREGFKEVSLNAARGKYLEEAVAHYTVGTYITSRVINELKKQGIMSVKIHDKAPGFEPFQPRLLDVPAFENDWASQLYSTYLEKKLLNAANTGMDSLVGGPSPILGLAYGKGFGKPTDA